MKETCGAKAPNKYFLPYQMEWLKDTSKIKIWQKSRRIGATYVQAYEDVRDCVSRTVPSVWFSSADESAAKEYILYCAQWAKLFDKGARDLGEQVLESDKSVKTFTIEFTNGARINALSSNPKAFRSKGGKVVLDEFAFHADSAALWKAAKPVITWGFPLRILSTHHGKQSLYFKFIEQIQKGKLHWKLHSTDIFKAVEDGLLEKIFERKVSAEEKQAWLKEEEENAFDRTTWLEEYCCIPVDEATAFLSYEQIQACETLTEPPTEAVGRNSVSTTVDRNSSATGGSTTIGDLFFGVDIGRRKDLTVIYGLEKLGQRFYLRFAKILERAPFALQKEILFELLKQNKFRRVCIDATGLGMQLAEETQTAFGKYAVEPVTFTGKVKEDLAYNLLTVFDDRNIAIPADHELREDLHSIRKVITPSNNIRFDVEKSEVSGHADRFWALALALSAGKGSAGDIHISTGKKRESYDLTKNY